MGVLARGVSYGKLPILKKFHSIAKHITIYITKRLPLFKLTEIYEKEETLTYASQAKVAQTTMLAIKAFEKVRGSKRGRLPCWPSRG